MSQQNEAISFAFKDMANYKGIMCDSSKTFDWYILRDSVGSNYVYHMLKVYQNPQFIKTILREELNTYQSLICRSVIPKSEFDTLFAPILRYAIECSTANAEVHLKYSGFPIIHLFKKIKDCKDETKAQFILKILKLSAEKLKVLEQKRIIHGGLSSEAIYFNPDTFSLRFQCSHSTTVVENEKKFLAKYINDYYKYTTYKDEKPKHLSFDEAISADIKALLLSIYEIGLPENVNLFSKLFIDDHMKFKVNELINFPEHVQVKSKSQESLIFLEIIKESLNSTSNITYEYILGKLPNFGSDSIPYISNTCPVSLAEATKSIKSVIPNITNSEMRKYGSFNVYLIQQNNTPFILKRYEQENSYNSEKAVLEYLSKFDGPLCLVKPHSKIQLADKELAMEYGGLNFDDKFKYAPKNSTLISQLSKVLSSVMDTLLTTRIFHCDIKPVNISINDDWVPKLFDYDISQIIPSNKSMTADLDLVIKGCSDDNAPPELIKQFLYGPSKLCPYKVDLYSLGKSIIRVFTDSCSEIDMLNNLYNLKDIQGTLYNKIESYLKSNPNLIAPFKLEQFKSSGNDSYYVSLRHLFYSFTNHLFIEGVKKYKAPSSAFFNQDYTKFMELLITTVSTDPTNRPSIEQLKQFHKSPINDIVSTYPVNINPMANIQEINSYKITYIEHAYDIEQFYLPVDGEENISQYVIAKYKAETQSYKLDPVSDIITHEQINTFASIIFYLPLGTATPVTYFIGGEENGETIKSMGKLLSNTYYELDEMKSARSEFGFTSCEQYIVVAGGKRNLQESDSSNDIHVDTVEFFNTLKEKWEHEVKIKKGKKQPALYYRESRLYIIGGIIDPNEALTDDNYSLMFSNTIEIIDTKSFQINCKTIQIATPLSDSIGNCICLPYDNDILILKGSLIENDSNENKCAYCLKINEAKATITECQLENIPECCLDLSCINAIKLPTKYLIIPDINTRLDLNENANGIMFEYNISNKAFAQIDIS